MSLPIPEVWHVVGKATLPTGSPFSQGTIKAFDIYGGTERQLGETGFDQNGNYTITYSKWNFQQGDVNREAPNLLVRIYDYQARILWQSPVISNASSEQGLNITLSGSDPVNDTWIVSGTVTNSLGQAVKTGQVVVYDKLNGQEFELGRVTIGITGAYSISYSKASFQRGDSSRLSPNLILRVLDAQGAVLVSNELGRSVATYEFIPLIVSVATPHEDGNNAVYGDVLNQLGLPLKDKYVKAYCLDFQDPQGFKVIPLGTAITDAKGKYFISYKPELLPRPITDSSKSCGMDKVAIYAELQYYKKSGSSSVESYKPSELIYNGKKLQQINFTFEEESKSTLSEYSDVHSVLSKYLSVVLQEALVHPAEGNTPARPYSSSEKIAALLGNQNRLELIRGRECLEMAKVKAYFLGQQLAYEFAPNFTKAGTGYISTNYVDFFYALIRLGAGNSKTSLLSLKPKLVQETLLTSVARGIISPISNITAFLTIWKAVIGNTGDDTENTEFSMYHQLVLAIHRSLDSSSPPSLQEKEKIKQLLGVYFEMEGDSRVFLQKVKPPSVGGAITLSEQEWSRFEFILDLHDFGASSADFMVGAFTYCNAETSRPKSLKEMQALTSAAWNEIVDKISEVYCKRTGEPANSLPPTLVGANVSEQKSIYALQLQKAIIAWFPQNMVSTKLPDLVSPSEKAKWEPVAAFLGSDVGKGFHLDTGHLDTFLEKHPSVVLSEEVKASIRALQRVYRFTTDHKNVAYLLSQNPALDSAYRIAQVDEDDFLADHCVGLGGMEKARQIHRLAVNYAAEAAAKIGKYHGSLNLDGESASAIVRGLSSAGVQASTTSSGSTVAKPRTPTRVVANWQNLFGSLNQSKVSKGQSILSPSAYLVDLLDFLKGESQNMLKSRRPDLWGIELTKENAETAMPTIDLAIELLEALVAKKPLKALQTSWSAPDLRAEPEHPATYVESYDLLANSYYPAMLPANFHRDEAKLLLEGMELSWTDLADALEPNAPRHVIVDEALIKALNGTVNGWKLWGLEERGNQILRPDKATMEAGEWLSILSVVAIFLDRAKISFQELVELLKTKTIGKYGVSISGDAIGYMEGDVNKFKLVGVTAEFAIEVNCFLRKMRLLGWSIAEMDEASLLSLESLDHIQSLAKTLKRPVFEVLSWGQGLQAAYFDRIFKPYTKDSELQDFYHLLIQNGHAEFEYKEFLGWIGSRTGLSNEDMVLLLDSMGLPNTNKAWDKSHVEVIYRNYSFARSMKLSIADWIRCSQWFGFAGWSWNGCLTFMSAMLTYKNSGLAQKVLTYLAFPPDAATVEKAEAFLEGLIASIDIKRDTATIPEIVASDYLFPLPGYSVEEYGLALTRCCNLLRINESGNVEVLSVPSALTPEEVERLTAWYESLVLEEKITEAHKSELLIALSQANAIERMKPLLDILHPESLKVLPGLEFEANMNALEMCFGILSLEGQEQIQILCKDGELSEEDKANASAWYGKLAELAEVQQDVLGALTSALNEKTAILRLQTTLVHFRELILEIVATDIQAEIKTQLVAHLSLPLDILNELVHNCLASIPVLPGGTFIPAWIDWAAMQDSVTEKDVKAYVRLAKASSLVKELSISDSLQLKAWVLEGQVTDYPSWNDYPTDLAGGALSWPKTKVMLQTIEVINKLGVSSYSSESLSSAISKKWNMREMEQDDILTECDLKVADGVVISVPQNWLKFVSVADIHKKTGILPAVLRRLLMPIGLGEMGQYIADLTLFRKSLMAKMTPDSWREFVQPIQDGLRSRKRDALAAYLCWKSQKDSWYPREFFDSNDLYSYYLIDVEMEPDMSVSRIRQALNTVQQFVQRAELGLEGRFALTDRQKGQWEWMRNYRVWEANRKVFLYAENWIEPELREDKSPFFRELENRLMEANDDPDAMKEALAEYLEKIREVSGLEIVGACKENGGENGIHYTLHVFGRTRGTPHIYYYRKYLAKAIHSGEWTPWDRIDAEISGSMVIPALLNQRLYLAWPMFIQSQDQSNSPSGGTNLGSTDSQSQVEVRMEWVLYDGKKWSGKKTSKSALYDVSPDSSIHKLEQNETIGDRYHFQSLDSSADFLQIKVFKTSYAEVRTVVDRTFEINAANKILHKVVTIVPQKDKQRIQEFGMFQIWKDGGDGATSIGNSSPVDVAAYPPSRCRIVRNCWVEDEKNVSVVSEIEKLIYPKGNAILDYTPGQHRLLPVNFSFYTGEKLPFFFMDNQRTYFVEEVPSDEIPGGTSYKFQLLSHPLVDEFYKRFRDGGLPWLFNRETQALPVADSYYYSYSYYNYYFSVYLGYYIAGDWQAWDLGQSLFEYRYQPQEGKVSKPYPIPMVDFSWGSSNAIYNWELFFHVPMMLATKMGQEHRYDEALKWFHQVFDPRIDLSSYEKTKRWTRDLPKGARFWRFLPFFANKNADDSISETLGMPTARDQLPDRTALNSLIEKWKNDPFNPHLIARYRPAAYQKFVVMKYLDNLIAWADELFTMDTMESINEAIQLYILAAEVLGPKSKEVPDLVEKNALTVQDVMDHKIDQLGNVLVQVEDQLVFTNTQATNVPSTGVSEKTKQLLRLTESMLYFAIPRNEKLLGYWDTVADRLYKIRNSMNIEGVKRVLALYAPPIDPGMLVRAKAAGLDIGAVLSASNAPLPLYRFNVMVQKAVEIVRDVQSLGSTLLSTLEKKDAEALTLLRTNHEQELLKLNKGVRTLQINEAKMQLEVLQKNKETTEVRYKFYKEIDKISTAEWAHMILVGTGDALQVAAGVAKLVAAGTVHVPEFEMGAVINAFGGPSFNSKITGGEKISKSSDMVADSLQIGGQVLHSIAGIVQLNASYERRWAEWKLQEKLAEKELASIEKQLLAAEIRIQMAEKELSNMERQIEQVEEVYEFMRSRFTNQELFQWLATQLSQLYSKTFQLALDVAKRAERCYNFELGLDTADATASFIQSTHWDGLRKGLLAGDRLLLDLRRLETAYLDKNRREFEITKPISLALLSTPALKVLRKSGSCVIDIPEVLFDLDFPGHYFRRIKAVRLEIPCAAGPHTSVSAKLSLVGNKMRHTPSLAGGSYREFEYFETRVGIQSIATSQAQNDGGMFELNFRDERYLPFEGAGAISTWRLELPAEFRQFDYESIADVILHISYTAREGGERLKKAATASIIESWSAYQTIKTMGEGLVSEIRLDRDFYDHLQLLRSTGKTTITIDPKCFPAFVGGSGKLQMARIFAKEIPGKSIAGISASVTLKDGEGNPVILDGAGAGAETVWEWSTSNPDTAPGITGQWTIDMLAVSQAIRESLGDLIIELRYFPVKEG